MVLFIVSLLVYTAPQIRVFGAVFSASVQNCSAGGSLISEISLFKR